MLDELNTELSIHKKPESNTTSKVWKLIPSCCTSFTPSAFMLDIRSSREMNKITARLDVLSKQRDGLRLTESGGGRSDYVGLGSRATTSVVEESLVVGRAEEKAAICKLLLEERKRNHDDKGGRDVCVTPIFGMGGLGKTNLAQLVSYALKMLPDNDCTSLLAWHALQKPNFDMHPDLKETGEGIARKCGGLPLAAKSLGGILRTKTSLEQWKKVLTSKIWDVGTQSNDILPALRLSYHHLPPHLKPLFVYCSIFPKDYEFEKMESRVHCSFSEKVRHSSFIHQKYGTYRKFMPYSRCLHLRTFLPMAVGNSREFYLSNKVLNNLLPKLRCLRVLSLSGYRVNELPRSIADSKHLRYLDMSNTDITQLPESVCELYNLQTLLLRSCDKLNQLPKGIRKLVNLRHLDIANTPALKWMPFGIGTLSSLCTLLSKVVIGKRNGFQISELKGLPYLKGTLAIIGMQNIGSVEEAREANLSGKGSLDRLEMTWDENFEDCRDEGIESQVLDVLKPSCKNLKYLPSTKQLVPKTDNKTIATTESSSSSNNNDETEGFHNLKTLIILNCPCLTSLPTGKKLPSTLTHLHISECENLEEPEEVDSKEKIWLLNSKSSLTLDLHSLPTSFTHLRLVGMFPELISLSDVKILLPMSLTRLDFWGPVNLESLSDGLRKLASLEELSIRWCPKVRSLPDMLLPTLSSLEIIECPLMKEKCRKDKGYYWDYISGIPCVKIDDELLWGGGFR